MQFYRTAFTFCSDKNSDICCRKQLAGLLRPFDDADVVAAEILAKTRLDKFLRAAHAVEIKVQYLDGMPLPFDRVGFKQGIRRALHATGVAHGAQHLAREKSLAGAQITLQVNRHARLQQATESRAKLRGGGLILKKVFSLAHKLECKRALEARPPMIPSAMSNTPEQLAALARSIKDWGRALGFAEVRVTDVDLGAASDYLQQWLAAGFHGQMDFMAAHGSKRTHPAQLVPGTVRVISARMDYLPNDIADDWREREQHRQADPDAAVISVYARGRDYHKVMRSRLQRLVDQISIEAGPIGYRVFTDSAPVMEVALAQKAGLGWRGKHTLLLNRDAGSMFFLGEIYTDLPLPVDEPVSSHCGDCVACIDVCPTQAIVGPYKLDARRCISYLTIELKDSIPIELRPLMGNRIYGCDDCQLVCPWNKFAQRSPLPDFDVREGLDHANLIDLFQWSEQDFEQRLEGNPIRRIGHIRWLRNIAVALGNAASQKPRDQGIVAALLSREHHHSELVREHVAWALAQHAMIGSA